MKITLSTYEIANLLLKDQYAGWSYAGAQALAEYLDENFDENEEFDVVAIRCEFTEYASLLEWAESMAFEREEGQSDEEWEEAAREYIENNGMLIEFEGGIIVSNF